MLIVLTVYMIRPIECFVKLNVSTVYSYTSFIYQYAYLQLLHWRRTQKERVSDRYVEQVQGDHLGPTKDQQHM